MRLRHQHVLSIAIALFIFAACAPRNPPSLSASQVQTVRVNAVRIADGTKTAMTILREVGKAANNAELDQAIVAATGTTANPGPLPKALDELSRVTADPDLKALAQDIVDRLRPVLDKLTDKLAGYGAILRTALSAAASYIGVTL